MSDALERSDPAFFINDVVESLDLTRFAQRYSVEGEHAYAPQLLLKLWLYAATQGVYIGREIGRRLRRDLGCRYWGGDGPHPDVRTINRFRARHREDCGWVLRATVDLARRAGMAQLGVVTVDGTKRRANTSRHKARSYGRRRNEEARLEGDVQAILQRMDDVNTREDDEHGGDDAGGGGVPAELQSRTARRACAARAARHWARVSPPNALADPTADAAHASPAAFAVATALYARRKTQGERPFAEVKHAMGFRRFMLRGVAKVRGEWDLVAAASNLRRLQVMKLALH